MSKSTTEDVAQPQIGPHWKKEFNLYLEQSGLTDLLTNTLVCVYKEPDKALNLSECIKTRIAAASFNPEAQKLDQLEKTNHETHLEIERLQDDNRRLRALLGTDAVTTNVPNVQSRIIDVSAPVLSPGLDGKTKAKLPPSANPESDSSNKSMSKPNNMKDIKKKK